MDWVTTEPDGLGVFVVVDVTTLGEVEGALVTGGAATGGVNGAGPAASAGVRKISPAAAVPDLPLLASTTTNATISAIATMPTAAWLLRTVHHGPRMGGPGGGPGGGPNGG